MVVTISQHWKGLQVNNKTVAGTATVAAAALATLVVLLFIGTPAYAAAPVRLHLPRLNMADVGAPGKIRDTIGARRRPLARTSQAPSGGVYFTADGSTPSIVLSPAYVPNPAAGQSLADFFGLLMHGDELSELTVYVAPFAEMQSLCGAEADSCYAPSEDTIYLVGEPPPDGATLSEIAAHEY